MKQCRHFKYKLSAYIDNRLSGTDRQAVEKHLAECSNCRSKFGALKNYQSMLVKLKRKQAPNDMETRVLQKAGNRVPEKGFFNNVIPLWLKSTAVAAVFIALFYLLLPKSIFEPAQIIAQYIPVETKRGKGPAKEPDRNKKSDPRIQQIADLLKSHDGQITEVMQTDDNTINGIRIKILRKNYAGFVEKYNHLNLLIPLPDKVPFSFHTRIDLVLYFESKAYQVIDYNQDAYDDLLMLLLSGKNKGLSFIAINDTCGQFLPPIPVSLDETQKMSSVPQNKFFGDFNGDGLDDILIKKNTVDSSGWYVSCMGKEGKYHEQMKIGFEPHASGYVSGFVIFTGDFNGDGYIDLLAKHGSSTHEGTWYISLNNQQGGFKLGYPVVFGRENSFFVAPR